MIIEQLNIPHDLIDDGLKDIELNKLKNLVLISGKNGSGKTRFLNAISKVIVTSIEHMTSYGNHPGNGMVTIRNMIKSHADSFTKNPNNKAVIPQIEKFQLMSALVERQHSQKVTFTLDNESEIEKLKVISFVPQSLNWIDNRTRHENENSRNCENSDTPGSETTHQWICAYIRKVSDKYMASTNPAISAGTPESRKKSIEEYNLLNQLTKSLLGKKFEFSDLGRPILFGGHIVDAKLSDGQKVLLQLAVQIHAQAENMTDVIILLDEPENHLHPQACIDFIVKVRSIIPNNQLWVSTHSIPILSYFFEESTLLFVNDGEVKYRGSAPEEVFKSLLGNDERVQKLRDFLGLPSEYAMLKYSRECLLPPDTHSSDGEDPQGNQIFKKINELKIDKKRVLDFGAGKGRILVELTERSTSIKDTIDYIAYDKFNDDKEACENIIETIYEDGKNRYFNNLSEISGDFSNGSVDIILMCNVLHEIEPSSWLDLFGEDSTLVNLLKNEGSLLLVEDEEIPIGEKAYKQGFIVLGKAELRILFNIKETESAFISDDHRGDGRLMAHLIPKTCLTQITSESIQAALKAKQKRAKEEIDRLRQSEASYKNGRKHGFWIQQYTNTSLVLDTLG